MTLGTFSREKIKNTKKKKKSILINHFISLKKCKLKLIKLNTDEAQHSIQRSNTDINTNYNANAFATLLSFIY